MAARAERPTMTELRRLRARVAELERKLSAADDNFADVETERDQYDRELLEERTLRQRYESETEWLRTLVDRLTAPSFVFDRLEDVVERLERGVS